VRDSVYGAVLDGRSCSRSASRGREGWLSWAPGAKDGLAWGGPATGAGAAG
jgi:hypothetical protein